MIAGTQMSPDRWQRIKHVLERSLELAPAERPAYLDQTCAGDPDLRSEIDSLIASYEEGGDLLETPALESGAEVLADSLDENVLGRRIGPYRIEAEIARGGMGAVYRATRADGHFQSQAAIKLIKRGMGDEFIIRRFRHERQIMANLEHPNIARLLDGGSTEDGLPYFVMEYIEGRPVDKYCDERQLSIRERLELFRTVCAAVQYAHDQLVVHRDIKPGNILITADGTPKLLDFGIAKLVSPEGITRAGGTITAVRLMTPEYASPEQVMGEPVTLATDIYSLGVLLYELLTGRRPYRVRNTAPHELARAICEVDPERPSTVVRRKDNGDTAAELSRARRTQPEKLRRMLRGDLDNIVMMAMRKEPQRRYASVEQFSEDIRRYLGGFPVTARKDTLAYRTAKFVERHKAGVAAALTVAVLAAGLVSVSGRRRGGELPLIAPLTSFPGDESQPIFSPDGKKVAFVWNGDGDNLDIYVRTMGGSDLVRITTDAAQDNSPAWSPDGRWIAFLRWSQKETAIFISPAQYGVHRKIADVYRHRIEPAGIEANGRPFVWSPDGKYLAIGDRTAAEEPFSVFLIKVADGSRTRVTYPPERTIGDSLPAFSPDGRWISFVRAPSSGVNDLYVMSLEGGGARRVTADNRDILSQTWSPDGRWLVFSSNRTGSYNLWRVSPDGGAPERLPGIGIGASDASFSQDGRRMAYSQFFLDTNIWSVDLAGGNGPRRRIVSTQYDSSAQFSPDGTRVAFRSSRSGAHEIWVASSDGLTAQQVTHFGGPLTGTPRWSPDGNWIAFDTRPNAQPDIYVVSARGGEPRQLTHTSSEDVVPSWSRDGRWVYFASNRSGAWQVWRIPSAGGTAEQVTRFGGFAAFESPDGKFVYYAKGRSIPGLWRMGIQDRREEPVMEGLRAGFWGYWAVGRRGIYFLDQQPEGTGRGIYFYDLASRRVRPITAVERRPMIGDSAFALSPDERTILFTQIDQSGSDIMLATYGR